MKTHGDCRPPWRGFLVGLLCLTALPALYAAPAAEGFRGNESEDEVDKSPARSALLLFYTNKSALALPLAPSAIRTAGNQLLSEALSTRGYEFLPSHEVDPFLRKWRMRSDRDIHSDFLLEIGEEMSLDRLFVTNLVVYSDRILLLARAIIPDTGWIVSVDVIETLISPQIWTPIEGDTTAWNKKISEMCNDLADRWQETSPEGRQKPLVVLPMAPMGIEVMQAELSTHCLLRSLLRTERWRLPDPSLVVSSLMREGYDPNHLESEGRRELTSRFGAELLIQSRVLSYEMNVNRTGPLYELENGDNGSTRPPLEWDAQLPIHLALMMIEGDSGRIISAGAEYLKPESSIGLFGLPKGVMMSRRIQKGTNRLIGRLTNEEDF